MSREVIHVEPPSKIATWEGWPDDVRDTLRKWNRQRGLTFGYVGHYGPGRWIFKCSGCLKWHEVTTTVASYQGNYWCDPCMITLARAANAQEGESKPSGIYEPRPGWPS